MKYMYLAGTTTKAADHKFKFKSSDYRTQVPCKKTNQRDRNFIFINSDPSSTFLKLPSRFSENKTFCAILHDG